jgi:MFS family permease
MSNLSASEPVDVRRAAADVRRTALLSSFFGWLFDGFETSSFFLVGATAVAALQPDLTPGSVQLSVGVAISATLLGWAIGGISGSILADYVGRKPMLIIAIAGYSMFTALTALSVSIQSLIALRFVTGLFLGSEWSTGTALVAESWPTKSRAKALGVMQSGYGFGFLLASAIWLYAQPRLGPDAWRYMFAVGVLPALFILYVRRNLPESQLWLKAKAQRADQKVGAIKSFTLAEVLAERRYRAYIVKTLVLASITVAVFYGATALIPGYVGAIASKEGLDGRQWATLAAVAFNLGAIASYILAGWIAEAFGRRTYMTFVFCGGVISAVVMFAVPNTLVLAMAGTAMLGFFILGSFSWMPIYLPELFPTRVRATATGFVFNVARLVAFPAPIYSAWLLATFGTPAKSVVSLSCLLVISVMVVWMLPETKGKSLPE